MKANTKQKHTPLSRVLFLAIFLPIILTLMITVGVSLYFALTTEQKELDTTISDTARTVAQLPAVIEMLQTKKSNPELLSTLRGMEDNYTQVDVLVVCDSNSVRWYHTNSENIGEDFVGDDQHAILEGADPYISKGTGTFGPQRRAFCAVKDSHGNILGFVMASVLNKRLHKVRKDIISIYLLIFLLLFSVGLITAEAFQYRLKTILLGYDPEELALLYVERSEVLNALEEGIFAINTKGEVTLMNDSAKKMLDLPVTINTEGHPLTEYYPETQLPMTVKTGITETNISFVINHKNIISSRIPIRRNNKIVGAVSIFRNRTEVTKLADQLTGANYMVDTLRTFNHEFMNRLHVILGLLEMGEIEKAKDSILNTSLVSGQAVSDIHHRVPVASLAALLIGKLVRAKELGIDLILKKDTYFYTKERELPADCYVTLVGNLIENAIDELNSGDFPEKRIELGIYSDEGHTTIVCDDTGGGIPEDVLIHIYDRKTTTKGPGHGSGFYVMKQIVDRYEGTFHIDTELGEGTSIEINLPI